MRPILLVVHFLLEYLVDICAVLALVFYLTSPKMADKRSTARTVWMVIAVVVILVGRAVLRWT
jgi:hypothetical protein